VSKSTASQVDFLIVWKYMNYRPQTGKAQSDSVTPELLTSSGCHFRCSTICTRLSKITSKTMRVAIAAASPKFRSENPTW
jgi:hypothetical protein